MEPGCPVFARRCLPGDQQVQIRIDPYCRPPADFLEPLLDADRREDLPVFHQFTVEEAYLRAEFDYLFHERFVLPRRKTDVEAEITVITGIISVYAVYLAQGGEVDTDAVAPVSLREALYFPVRQEMSIQRKIAKPPFNWSCHFELFFLIKNRRLTFRSMKKAEEGFDGLVVNKNQKVELRNFHLRFNFLVLCLQKYRKSLVMSKIGQRNIFFRVKMYNNPLKKHHIPYMTD